MRLRFDDAIGLMERSQRASTRAGADGLTARTLLNLGNSYSELGQLEAAERNLLRARALFEQLNDRAGLQLCLGSLGSLRFYQGNYGQAEADYQRGLALARELKSPRDAARWLNNLALTAAQGKEWGSARRYNDEAIALKRAGTDAVSLAHSRLTAALIEQGEGRLAEAEATYREVLGQATEEPSLAWEAHGGLAAVRVAQGQATDAERHFRAAIRVIEETQSDRLSSSLSKVTFLSRLIGFFQEYVDFLVSSGQPERALAVAESSRARLLAERLGRTEGLGAPARRVSFPALSRSTGRVLLSYWVAPKRSFLWVVTPAGVACHTLPTQAELERDVRAHQEMVEALRDPLEERSATAQRLSRALLSPASAALRLGARVVVVPDGPLHLMNLESLPAPERPGQAPGYWIEEAEVSVSPSLPLLGARGAARPGTRSLLLMGDPQPGDASLPALPHARREVEAVTREAGGAERTVLTGAEAYPAAYARARPSRFSLIHFTAHATANAETPLASAIHLSARDGSPRLYASDVLAVQLRAELVTVSACRGAGARSYAGEGLLGFMWAFLHAGARNVIAGLWDVADASTADLMGGLYHGLAEGRTPAGALREAKLAMLRQPGRRAPFYWAPFQVFTAGP